LLYILLLFSFQKHKLKALGRDENVSPNQNATVCKNLNRHAVYTKTVAYLDYATSEINVGGVNFSSFLIDMVNVIGTSFYRILLWVSICLDKKLYTLNRK